MRRAQLLTAGAIAGAGILTGTPAIAAPSPAPPWSAEYWAAKGSVKLYLYRKRAAAPGGGAALPVLFLVHGSSMSGRSTFDLAVPGQANYSMMNAFAAYGYDVWTMDFEGYGRSDRTSGNSDIASGVADLAAAMTVVRRETGQARVHLFGESSGGIRATAFAAAHPESVARIGTSAYTYTGKGSPTLGDRAKQVDYYRTHNMRPATLALYRSIFTRDKAGTADPAVGDALYAAEQPFGGQVPTGTYLDMVTKLPIVDPKTIHAPVMIARGEYDGIATQDDLIAFFEALPNNDKQFVVIPGAAHSLVLGYNRERFWYALNAFLAAPPREDHVG